MDLTLFTSDGIAHFYQPMDSKARKVISSERGRIPLLDKIAECPLPANAVGRRVLGMAVNDIDDHLVALLDNAQILMLPMVSGTYLPICPELLELDRDETDASPFGVLGQGFISGPIVCMDACGRHPLIVAAGRDRTIRIWNYHHHKSVAQVRHRAAREN